jgi:hypothetical protein
MAQNTGHDAFRPLEIECPTPNESRLASGAPGPKYWQQRADYELQFTLDDAKQRIEGSGVLTYHNNSPHTLGYLWFQLDQNLFHPQSLHYQCEGAGELMATPEAIVRRLGPRFAGGINVLSVTDDKGKPLTKFINDSQMRVDLVELLKPNASVRIRFNWSYNINDAKVEGRSGYEYFPDDKNYLYEIAQSFPRVCVYSEERGWQHKPYLGRAEFALEFGDYDVKITAPSDHVVWGTGDLLNEKEVLTAAQIARLAKARTSDTLVQIITVDEAKKNQSSRSTTTKTWHFAAKNVRDFAFASSRKFAWDGLRAQVDGKAILAQSLYPPEAANLWGKYASHAVRHAVQSYSKRSVNYPYPHATAIHGPVWGMEYPMIAFCGGRPDDDGNYTKAVKYSTIAVIMHEVGHNFFPMIVNNDERRWAWMDEGLNSFLQYLAEQEWERGYPSRRGRPEGIADYMKSSANQPVMINPEAVLQVGNNQYGKVVVALNILRETILGRKLFDEAFHQYAQRWAYHHPEPCDFFRSMEDAAGVNLDWFWRGWFYSTGYVDIGIADVRRVQLEPLQPDSAAAAALADEMKLLQYRSIYLNDTAITRHYVDERPELRKDYRALPNLRASDRSRQQYREFVAELSPEQQRALSQPNYIYQVTFENVGGLPMPIVFDCVLADGTRQRNVLTAEAWQLNMKRFTKELVLHQALQSIELDAQHETADADYSNNYWPVRPSKAVLKVDRD